MGDVREVAEEDSAAADLSSSSSRSAARRFARLAGAANAGGLTAIDLVLGGAFALLALAVHDVGYMLHHPFWVDEAWVADSARARIGLLPTLTSSTPIGWSFLLRLVPFGGAQRLRLVPLAFTALAGGAAYFFGRELRLTRYGTGILTGTAVLLSPAMLARDDLKAYTAEAFFAIVVLLLVARIEAEWEISGLVWLAAVSSLGMLFANTVILVGAAAMAGLAVECLVQRRFGRLLQVFAAAGAMLAAAACVYELADARNISKTLTNYWLPFYLSLRHPGVIYTRLEGLAPYMGFHRFGVDAGLALAGMAVLLVTRRVALALVLPLTLVINVFAAATHRFPFGDPRTSTYWLVMVPLLMAVVVATAARESRRLHPVTPMVCAAAGLAVWVPATHGQARSHSIANEDVRSQARYVEANYRRGDVIVVDVSASWGFAYYYRAAAASYAKSTIVANGFVPVYPHDPDIITMPDRQAADVYTAFAQAERRLAADGGHGRMWIVRSHLHPVEEQAWARVLNGARLVPVGPEPLLVYQPAAPAQAAGPSG